MHLGFTDFRVRQHKNTAILQVTENLLPLVLEKRKEILTELEKYYDTIVLDLYVR